MKIGMIGLGAMGREIARNLVAAGHSVYAWNRSGGYIDGVTWLDDARSLFELQIDAVLTMLSDDQAIRDVIIAPGLLQYVQSGVTHVVMSTISVDFSKELLKLHSEADIPYVAAPVLGRPDAAANAELHVLAAGPLTAIEHLRSVFNAISRQVWIISEDAPAANATKIACNMMVMMAIQAMAEAVVLTESNGLPRAQFFEIITNTLFSGRIYDTYSDAIAEHKHTPGFKATLGLKDLELAEALAHKTNRSVPQLMAVCQHMRKAIQSGIGEKDWSAIAEYTIEHPN